MNMLGGVPNMSSLLNQSFGNGGQNSGLSGPGSSQRGGIDAGAESDPLSGVANGMGFSSPSSFVPSNMVNAGPSGQVQGQQFSNPPGNQLLPDQQQPQQLDAQTFQQPMQQFSAPHNTQQVQQQHQFQTMRGGMGAVGPVKMEPQVTNDQHGTQQQQLRNLGSVKLEPQQMQTMRSLAPMKLEPQHSDQSMFLHQQQQQQFLNMSRQSSHSAAAQFNLLHQQRLLQLQQHQQRSQLPQQFQPQNLPLRSPAKPVYEPGMCARRLTRYMYQQQHRPEDNNIEFWRKFVAEYFAPNARKKWCVSMYGSGRQATGVFPQDVWHCEICNRKPGRGFEATVEVLPRLFKIKYESGTLEELLYVDMPHEYPNSSGQIVLDYAKAIQESVFEQLRVVRDGQLRIVFSPELKICSWEFCARRHEELIPRRLLIPQVSQLSAAAQKYQAATQNTSSSLSNQELLNNCNMFVQSARQLAKALEVPLVNDLGYTKRYIRCLQISEVVNSMKDLVDYSRETGTGPMESLAKFPRRTSSSSGFNGRDQQSEPQQQPQPPPQPQALPSSSDPGSIHAGAMQVAATNSVPTVNNAINAASTATSQNSMNSRHHSSMNNASSPYAGNSALAPSPGSSNTVPQAQQPNPSPFQSPTPSSSSAPQMTNSALAGTNHASNTNSPANIPLQQPALASDADHGDSQSSVQKILHEMMMSNQLNGAGGAVGVGAIGNDMKNVNSNGNLPTSNNSVMLNGGNNLVGNGAVNSSGIGGFGSMGGVGQSGMANGMRSAMGSNSLMNGRMAMASMVREQAMNNQQQDLGNQLLSGLGAVNGFNNLQFDWKPSP
ncbi:Transcriptional corepressor SEUSS [Linum perenne]